MKREIFKCLMSFDESQAQGRGLLGAPRMQRGAIFLCDAFEEGGAFWLVPKWLHYPGETTPTPERAIRVEKTSVRPLGAAHRARYLIPEPLPAILRDAVTAEEIPPGYQVRFALQGKA